MTENDAENDFQNNRERALWPDEPSPFEDPFRYEAQVAEERAASETLPSEVSIERDILEIRDLTPPRPDSAIPSTNAAGGQVSEVWLNGPPPDEFPFVETQPSGSGNVDPWPDPIRPFEPPFVPVVYTPESAEETIRQTGLAWSAGIVFFGSVAFMLFLGWLADLVLGSSPWGIVAGVVLGSIIGFIQFFRISSQIFAPKKSEHRPLLSRDDDES